MRILLICSTCMQEQMENFKDQPLPSNFFSALPNSDFIYKWTCEKGHINQTILQMNDYELLFEIGIYALKAGYADCAVTRFITALDSVVKS